MFMLYMRNEVHICYREYHQITICCGMVTHTTNGQHSATTFSIDCVILLPIIVFFFGYWIRKALMTIRTQCTFVASFSPASYIVVHCSQYTYTRLGSLNDTESAFFVCCVVALKIHCLGVSSPSPFPSFNAHRKLFQHAIIRLFTIIYIYLYRYTYNTY